MAKTSPRTVRLEEELDSKVQKWLAVNKKAGIDFSTLVNFAVKEYIAKPQAVHLDPISMEEGRKALAVAMKKHRKAIDELK